MYSIQEAIMVIDSDVSGSGGLRRRLHESAILQSVAAKSAAAPSDDEISSTAASSLDSLRLKPGDCVWLSRRKSIAEVSLAVFSQVEMISCLYYTRLDSGSDCRLTIEQLNNRQSSSSIGRFDSSRTRTSSDCAAVRGTW